MPHLISATDAQRIARVKGKLGNWSTDKELVGEIAEALTGIGDVQYGTVVSDPFKQTVRGKLQDGRDIKLSISIE